MRLIKIVFTVTLMLFAATGFAAPKEKILICHVGNEVGPGGEDYLDDPGCVPIEDNGYFCPDAGKIDLINVAKPAKHLGNDSHMYDGISDYEPGDVGASGEGNEDSNGDGIDDGCEPELTCPCYTMDELVAGGPIAECGDNWPGFPDLAGVIYSDGGLACSGTDCAVSGGPSCRIATSQTTNIVNPITTTEDADCRAMIMLNCPNPNGPVQSASATGATLFIDQ